MAATTTTTLRNRMTEDLQLRGLSARTQEAYLRAVRKLAEYFRTPPDRLREEQVREYLLYLKNDRGFAPGSMRIVACDETHVTFRYRKSGSRRWRTMRLKADEFVRRFLQHVLPRGLQKVRHFGLLSPNARVSIGIAAVARCRRVSTAVPACLVGRSRCRSLAQRHLRRVRAARCC